MPAIDFSSLDSSQMLVNHNRLIRNKVFLNKIYQDYYHRFKLSLKPFLNTLSKKKPLIVELGTGAGFLKEIIPEVITSDVIGGRGIDKVFFAEKMPLKNKSVSAFLMYDVLHHIKNPEKALKEMSRCLVNGGRIIMIEPCNSLFGRFIYQHLHHENFDPDAGWTISGKGRLSDANGAIPYIIFIRDRKLFEKKFPGLEIVNIEPHTPIRYLLSGGLSKPQLLPSFTYPLVLTIEKLLSPLNAYMGMFMTIEIQKKV